MTNIFYRIKWTSLTERTWENLIRVHSHYLLTGDTYFHKYRLANHKSGIVDIGAAGDASKEDALRKFAKKAESNGLVVKEINRDEFSNIHMMEKIFPFGRNSVI